MTGSLNLRVDVLFRGSDLVDGTTVLANIYPVEGSADAHRGVLIPAGDDVPTKRFDVDAGRYVVEAVLPSGKVLTDEATVGEGEDVTVALDATDSPHESHSWQYFSGNIEPRATYDSAETIPVPRSMSSRYFDLAAGDALAAPAPGDPAAGPLPTPDMVWIPDSRTEGWSFEKLNELAGQMLEADLARIEAAVSEGPMVPIADPTETDLTSHLYRFDHRGPIAPPGSPSAAGAATGARQFVVAASAGDAYLVTLPNPWTNVLDGSEVQIELLVNSRQSPTGSPVAVTVRDRALGSGLAYLATGAFAAAARVFRDVEGMLYGKVMNPLAAAAGAYVLVGTETDTTPKPWHDWLENLAGWFGWMSDGAVLWATHALRGEGDRRDDAKNALIDAYGRGVPFFTVGLSWLVEGLSEFPEDEQCSHMLDEVRRLAWRIDTRQPFVVLRLNGRTA